MMRDPNWAAKQCGLGYHTVDQLDRVHKAGQEEDEYPDEICFYCGDPMPDGVKKCACPPNVNEDEEER
jgi:hypothetical protein